jgi:hypothetical protein
MKPAEKIVIVKNENVKIAKTEKVAAVETVVARQTLRYNKTSPQYCGEVFFY